MALVDMSAEELAEYRGSCAEPADFEEFWADTLACARACPGQVQIERHQSPLRTVDVFDVHFPGFGGEPISAWLRLPAGSSRPVPVVVEFVGYGGGRGYAEENLLWASCGLAHLQMDTRGQGAQWAVGDTPDADDGGQQYPGMMTRGIAAPASYYYRRLIVDAVRAVDAVASLPGVDASQIHIHGRSQGGGIAIAVAGLVPGLASVTPLVPFLCDFPRAITVTDSMPYKEIGNFIKARREDYESVLHTLQYFDGVNFARRATAPAHFSASLMDEVCPPSTVYAAFNNYRGPKDIRVWPFNGHEGGGPLDDLESLDLMFGR